MTEKKAKTAAKAVKLNVKVVTDKGEGNDVFEREINKFINREDVVVKRIEYTYRNNANVAYVEHNIK